MVERRLPAKTNLKPNTVEPPLTDILYQRTPHYTGQNVAVRIEFALRVILYSSPECGHLATPYYGHIIKSQRS